MLAATGLRGSTLNFPRKKFIRLQTLQNIMQQPNFKWFDQSYPLEDIIQKPIYVASMNIWFWLLIVIVPLIVFSVSPEASVRLRMGRLFAAVAVCYGLMFLTLQWQYTLEQNAIDAFYKKFPSCEYKPCSTFPDCETSLCPTEPKTSFDGPLFAFVIVFGWIAAISYTGVWELVWRIYYRTRVRNMGQAFRYKWISTVLIIFSLLIAYPVWPLFYRLAYYH